MSVWYEKGIRFACTGCGDCCVDHGDYAYVFLFEGEETRLARALGLEVGAFLDGYTQEVEGFVCLVNRGARCVFLEKPEGCAVYRVRPLQCRTWPFWRENLKPRVWKAEVVPHCPGVGRGRLHSAEEIDRLAAKERFEKPLLRGAREPGDRRGGPG